MRTLWRDIWSAWRNEYSRIWRDRGALLVLGIAAILYALIYPIPYKRQVLTHVPIVVVDEDHSSLSRQLVRMTNASQLVTVVADAGSIREAQTFITEGRAGGALVIPAGFERTVLRGGMATVGALGDASYFLTYRQVLTAILSSSATMSAQVEVRNLVASGSSVQAAMVQRDPIPFLTRTLYDPSSGYASYVVPAVLIIILQQTLLIGLGMLGGAEREQRMVSPSTPEAELPRVESTSSRSPTLEIDAPQETVATPSPLATLLGRTGTYLTIYLGHTLFFLAVVYSLYGFPRRGALPTILLFLIPFLLASIFLGMAIASMFRERETAMQMLLFTSLPSVFLAGFSWPPEAIPHGLREAALLLPSTAGIRGYLRVTQMGASLEQVQWEWTLLWGLVIVYFWLAWLANKRSRASARYSTQIAANRESAGDPFGA